MFCAYKEESGKTGKTEETAAAEAAPQKKGREEGWRITTLGDRTALGFFQQFVGKKHQQQLNVSINNKAFVPPSMIILRLWYCTGKRITDLRVS